MRAAVLMILAATPAFAFDSLEACAEAVARSAEEALIDAERWVAEGGGTQARLCEAAALEGKGALGTAALRLTRLGDDPAVALPRDQRAAILAEAGRLWLLDGQNAFAREVLRLSNDLAHLPVPDALRLARAEAGVGDYEAARQVLDAILAAAPADAEALALRAATHRARGAPDAALADADAALALADRPDARFERAAALAELGQREVAIQAFVEVIDHAPDSDFADLSRNALARLAVAD